MDYRCRWCGRSSRSKEPVQRTSHAVLSPLWTLLVNGLQNSSTKRAADQLFEKQLINKEDYGKLIAPNLACSEDRARLLLEIVMRFQFEDCIAFARLLNDTKGEKALAEEILKQAEIVNAAWEEEHSLSRDDRNEPTMHSHSRGLLAKGNKSSHFIAAHECDSDGQLKSGHRSTQTPPEALNFRDDRYKDTFLEEARKYNKEKNSQFLWWDALPNLPSGGPPTMNCVVAIDNTLFAACQGSDVIYSLAIDKRDIWKAHVISSTTHGSITNLFTDGTSLYMTAGSGYDNNIYKSNNLEANVWTRVTNINSMLPFESEANWTKSYFFPKLGRQKQLTDVLRHGSVCATSQYIYMFYDSRFKAFDLQKNQLLDQHELPFPTCCPSSFLHHGMLLLGSTVQVDMENRQRLVTKLSSFRAKKSKWTDIATIKRHYANITNFLGKIVVTGGRDLEHDDPLSTVKVWDPDCSKWLQLPPMTHTRHLHGTCAAGNKLFAVGGFNNLTAEMFTFL